MKWTDLLQALWAPRRPFPAPTRRAALVPGQRVRLRTPLASPHTVWIPAGAAGIVVGGDPRARQVSIELDTPRTVVTVPWSWVEDEPESPPTAPDAGPRPEPP